MKIHALVGPWQNYLPPGKRACLLVMAGGVVCFSTAAATSSGVPVLECIVSPDMLSVYQSTLGQLCQDFSGELGALAGNCTHLLPAVDETFVLVNSTLSSLPGAALPAAVGSFVMLFRGMELPETGTWWQRLPDLVSSVLRDQPGPAELVQRIAGVASNATLCQGPLGGPQPENTGIDVEEEDHEHHLNSVGVVLAMVFLCVFVVIGVLGMKVGKLSSELGSATRQPPDATGGDS